MVTQIKIGRNTYDITEADRFLDNGACIQLLTQSKEKSIWGTRPTPVLPKREIKELSKFEHVPDDKNNPFPSCKYFGIKEA